MKLPGSSKFLIPVIGVVGLVGGWYMSGSVGGRLTGDAQAPITNVRIGLKKDWAESNPTSQYTTTDNDGKFMFGWLLPGNYQVFLPITISGQQSDYPLFDNALAYAGQHAYLNLEYHTA